MVLGGSGFVGSYLIRELLSKGHVVTDVDNFSKYGYIKHDFYGHKNFNLVNKDVRSMYPREYKDYDYVVCLAALIGGTVYMDSFPYQIARDNTEILSHAIDCTLAASPYAIFYYPSSSMIYERADTPVKEEDSENQQVPSTHYGMQKLFGEFLVKGANEEYGLNYVTLRLFNAVGSGELPYLNSKGEVQFGMGHVIPDFVYKALIKQDPFKIIGDGKQVRTFTHIKDTVNAITSMIEMDVKNDDFNICSKNTITIGELAEMIWNKTNPNSKLPSFKNIPAPKNDVAFRIGASDKTERILGWSPKYSLDDIIDEVIDYLRSKMPNIVQND